MQTFAFVFAVALLGLGAVLNAVILAYFAWRAARVLAMRQVRRRAEIQPLQPLHPIRSALAPAHR